MPERFTFGNGTVKRRPPLTVTKNIERKKAKGRPALGKERGLSRKTASRLKSGKQFKAPLRQAPKVSQKVFSAKNGTARKTIQTPKRTISKPRLNLQKQQTRILPEGKKSARLSPRRTTLKPQTLPDRQKSSSLALPKSGTKRSREFSAPQQQRFARRPLVKTQRSIALPGLRGDRL